MRFTVVWNRSAQNELALIWTRATDRNAVSNATNRIDRLLRFSPLTVGEEYGTDRGLLVDPLEVIFSVDPDDCMVKVLQVTYAPYRRSFAACSSSPWTNHATCSHQR